MKEYLIFKAFNIVAEVTYEDENNLIYYVTDRRMRKSERLAIEYFLLSYGAHKYDYYNQDAGRFAYLGVDMRVLDACRENARRVKESRLRTREAKEKSVMDEIRQLTRPWEK